MADINITSTSIEWWQLRLTLLDACLCEATPLVYTPSRQAISDSCQLILQDAGFIIVL